MSILITGAILLFAIALLAVNLTFITFALFNLGVSSLFKTIEEIFEGRNKGRTAEDYLIYAGIISASIFVVFALILIIGIVIAVLGAPEELAGAAGAGLAEESGAAELLPGAGDLISGTIGTILVIVLIVVVFASTGSGILSFFAASEIRKNPKFSGKKELRDAYNDAIIAGITGIAIVAFSVIAIIGYFVFKYYQSVKRKQEIEKIKEERKENEREAGKGIVRLIQLKAQERAGAVSI